MKSKKIPLGQYLFDNHDNDGATDEFLEATAPFIGFIVHSFNSLDEQLKSVICDLFSDRYDELGALVIYKMGYSAKIDLFQRLMRMKTEVTEDLNTLIQNLRKCGTLRNAVIHAEWDNIDTDGYTHVRLVSDKNGMKQEYMQFTPESLEKIDDLIHGTYMMFDGYMKDFKDGGYK